MEFDDIERLFYNDFKVFRRPRTPEEDKMTQSTAHWINRMAGMLVFDEDAINSLTKMTDNEQLERYFFFLLNQVFLRDKELAKLKDKYSFHIIVSDFREICTNIIEKVNNIMEAAFLTSQHLEVLAAVEAFVEEGKYRREDNLLQSAVRMVYLRFVLTELAADIVGEDRKQEIFHALGKIYEGYRSIVYHPTTEMITKVSLECSEFMFRMEGSVTQEMVDGLIRQLI